MCLLSSFLGLPGNIFFSIPRSQVLPGNVLFEALPHVSVCIENILTFDIKTI